MRTKVAKSDIDELIIIRKKLLEIERIARRDDNSQDIAEMLFYVREDIQKIEDYIYDEISIKGCSDG